MVNNIIERQNEERNLLHLAAQRNLYSSAKILVLIEIIIGGFLIGALYFLLPLLPGDFIIGSFNLKPFVGFIAPLLGFIFTIIDIWFINPEINNIKEKAAKIQESFDCNVLLLPWNNIKLDLPDNEEISLNASKYQKIEKNLESLKMWYAKPVNQLPLNIGRIVCQRINCWWDTSLRENYIKSLKVIGVCTLALVVFITLFEVFSTTELIVGIKTFIYGLFSFLYYYVFLMRQIMDNKKSEDKIIRIKQNVNKIWQSILNSDPNLDLDVLSRQIQDELFEHRKTTPIIPDWFYKLKRDEQESSSTFSVEKMAEDYKKAKAHK